MLAEVDHRHGAWGHALGQLIQVHTTPYLAQTLHVTMSGL